MSDSFVAAFVSEARTTTRIMMMHDELMMPYKTLNKYK
jgi:hypothetical protein